MGTGQMILAKKLGYVLIMVLAVSFAMESSAISGKSIRSKISKQRSDFRDCYDKNLKRFPRMNGETELSWTINDKGEAKGIKITRRMNRSVDRCLAKVLSEIHFPKAPEGQEITVSYPFVFEQAPFDNDRKPSSYKKPRKTVKK